MVKVKCYNIDYDTDGIKVKLPKTLIIEVEEKDWEDYGSAIDLLLCERISDITDWMVNSFEYERI